MKNKLEPRLLGENISNLRYAEDIILLAENEELKSLLMKVNAESEKVDLKLNIQKTKIMASSPITSWQIDGETVETVKDIIFGGSNITEDDDLSHEIKRRLLLGRKAIERLLLHAKTLGFLAPRGEEFNLGPETRLDCSEIGRAHV